MIRNLFSIFDPRTSLIIDSNWLSSLLNFNIIPLIFWLKNSRLTKIFKIILLILNKEFKIILGNKFNYYNSLILLTFIIYILLNNFIGLFPYIFTRSSHLIFSITLSLPLWLSLIIFGWIKNYNFIFSHIIPQGTPNILIPFIVIIETVRNIIRPRTLAIRLTANIIAGHLLLTLLSRSALSPFIFIKLTIIIIQIVLLILEFSVSIIQSYVFSILSTLYTKETNYE